ncbi:alpha/beta hydrolase [Prauserella sp. PE36]|uniref:Alpha/beta hydrolase n=1 Tax=Prauserella endophytica TaxID=1592324 RepID=A0ABY2S1D1_9PSEU|nr:MULTISPECIES: alpha/beta hydrolase [Prauserella]RBM10327.1 alpha/beta hydrolase [Prauserella sp. PE36]TKG68359.1 alpha/beta hydrolase [Prauserella endophytica]
MSTVTSADGTRIAYDRIGGGEPLILVDGAMCYRGQGPMTALAKELAPSFTVYTYDRRGRGESGNTEPYAVERELEDLAALLKEAGGSAHLFGASSGAMVALEAVNSGLPVRRLAMYEPPLIVDGSRPPIPADLAAQYERALAQGKPGDAVANFMRQVEVPGFMIALMRLMPVWRKLKGVAPTLPYDAAFVTPYQQGEPLPENRWTGVGVPTLVADGGKSPAWMRNGVKALADLLPGAEYRTLPGQTHMIKAKVLAPVLADFLSKP